MKKMERDGLIRFLGFVEWQTHYEKAYGLRRVSSLQHDFMVYETGRKFVVDDFTMMDSDVEPYADAAFSVLRSGGAVEIYLLEYDRGTETSSQQLQGRFEKLESATQTILWIFPSEKRRERVLSFASHDNHWGAILEDVIANPHAESIWTNRSGDESTLIMTNTLHNEIPYQ